MSCQLCHQDKPLVKAHIIPRCFYEAIKPDRKSFLYVVQARAGSFPKKSRTGHYDNNILCETCDGMLGKYDNYARRIIFDIPDQYEPFYHEHLHKVVGYQLINYDYSMLKLFFLSILWRASASQLPFFSNVILGKYESIIGDMIYNRDPGKPNDFPVFLSHFVNTGPDLTVLNPARTRMRGLNYYTFYLIACNAHIKVDRRDNFRSGQKLSMAPNRPLFVITRNYKGSNEEIFLKKVIQLFS